MIVNSLRSLVMIAVLIGLVYFASAFLNSEPAFSAPPKAPASISSEKAIAWQDNWAAILVGVIVGVVVAAISSALTLAVTQYGLKKERERNQKEQAESLKVAFWGEVNSIRLFMSTVARIAFKAWEEEKTLPGYIYNCPKAIFKGNAGRLGDLRDAGLVRHLVNFYSIIEVWEAKSRQIQTGGASPIVFIDYVILAVTILDLSVNLDMRLSEGTKHLEGDQPLVIVSEQDANDRSFTSKALGQLTETRMSLDAS